MAHHQVNPSPRRSRLQPGALVMLATDPMPHCVIAQLDDTTAMVRRLGVTGDRAVPLKSISLLVDGHRVRLGRNFDDSQ